MTDPVDNIHSLLLWAAEIYEAAEAVDQGEKKVKELTEFLDNIGGISRVPGVPSLEETYKCVVKNRAEAIHDLLAKLDRFDALDSAKNFGLRVSVSGCRQWDVLLDEQLAADHKLMPRGWREMVDQALTRNEAGHRKELLEILESGFLDELEERQTSVATSFYVHERYEAGTVVEGTVVASTKTKALIELPGYRLGAVLAQDFSWGDDPKPPARGSKVNVVVLKSSPESWRVVSVGMKQCFTDPSIKADVDTLVQS